MRTLWLAVLLTLVACTTDTAAAPSPSGAAATIRPEVPTFDASQLKTKTPIKHVVILMQENHSFDNMFGLFPGADGVSVGMEIRF